MSVAMLKETMSQFGENLFEAEVTLRAELFAGASHIVYGLLVLIYC